jgi:hypothetical protein
MSDDVENAFIAEIRSSQTLDVLFQIRQRIIDAQDNPLTPAQYMRLKRIVEDQHRVLYRQYYRSAVQKLHVA